MGGMNPSAASGSAGRVQRLSLPGLRLECGSVTGPSFCALWVVSHLMAGPWLMDVHEPDSPSRWELAKAWDSVFIMDRMSSP